MRPVAAELVRCVQREGALKGDIRRISLAKWMRPVFATVGRNLYDAVGASRSRDAASSLP